MSSQSLQPLMSAALNVQRLLSSFVVSPAIPAAVAVSLPLLPLMFLLLLQQVILTEFLVLLQQVVLTELSLSTDATGPHLHSHVSSVSTVADDAPFAKNSVVRGSNEVPRASLDLNCYGQTNTGFCSMFWSLSVSETIEERSL